MVTPHLRSPTRREKSCVQSQQTAPRPKQRITQRISPVHHVGKIFSSSLAFSVLTSTCLFKAVYFNDLNFGTTVSLIIIL